MFAAHAQGAQQVSPNDARGLIGTALKTRNLNRPDVFAALASLSDEVANGVKSYGSISRVPAAATANMRNDMYLAADAIRLLPEAGAKLEPGDAAILKNYRTSLEDGTRFIPTWVKVSVAIALGLGTMVGWRRIVVTVGERIGKQHLTYAQGASAELVAAGTILGAEFYGMPVSTTHILSSGVAGTMAANGSGLQNGHDQEHRVGMGSDIARGHADRRPAVYDVPRRDLTVRHLQRWSVGAPLAHGPPDRVTPPKS